MLRLTDRGQYAAVAAQLSAFAADLATRGLPAQLSFVPYQPQPGRYGGGPALAAAGRLFAADTACAIAQITAADRGGVPAQAWAAASMVRIAAAFAPDETSGCRTLVDCLPQQSGKLDRAVRDHTLLLTDAATGRSDPTNLAADDQVAAVWRMRDWALTGYFHTVRVQPI